MTRLTLLCLAAVLGASTARAQTMTQAAAAAGTSRSAAADLNADAAKRDAGSLFDGTAAAADQGVSPPPVMVPVVSPRDRSADLIIGTPGKDRISEPKSPLTVDGKPKEAKSSGGLWWTAGGAVVGAGVGFLIGGPIGAAIGAVALGLLAFFLRP